MRAAPQGQVHDNQSVMPLPAGPLRTECPPGSCICQRQALLPTDPADPAAGPLPASAPGLDARILLLTRTEEARLVQRLETVSSLAELRHLQQRMWAQLGLRLTIAPAGPEVRSLRGISILVHEQPGLCRKTRQALPAAIRRAMQQQPQIAWELLNEGGLFATPGTDSRPLLARAQASEN